jgi:hypothetical protein
LYLHDKSTQKMKTHTIVEVIHLKTQYYSPKNAFFKCQGHTASVSHSWTRRQKTCFDYYRHNIQHQKHVSHKCRDHHKFQDEGKNISMIIRHNPMKKNSLMDAITTKCAHARASENSIQKNKMVASDWHRFWPNENMVELSTRIKDAKNKQKKAVAKNLCFFNLT